jgi:hypothetical protein
MGRGALSVAQRPASLRHERRWGMVFAISIIVTAVPRKRHTCVRRFSFVSQLLPLWRATVMGTNQSGEVRMLTLSNTSLTRATKVADVPLIGLGLSLLFMAAIIAVAFIACAGLQ